MAMSDGESIDAADLMLPQRMARPAHDASMGAAAAGAHGSSSAAAQGVVPPGTPGSGVALDDYISNLERTAIMKALEESRYNKTAAAKKLGITFRALRYKLKKLGID
jgi:two-component system response regulator PilR (NtrC family)